MKISELYRFVHVQGMWQDVNCYETRIDFVNKTMIIANYCTYGSKENRERCMDAIILEPNKKGLYKIRSANIGPIDLFKFKINNFLLQEKFYKDYIIVDDMKKGRKK